MTCETAEALLVLKFRGFAGTNVAVMECEPTARTDVVSEALDVVVTPTWESAIVPMETLPPSKNVTVPVGKPCGAPPCVFDTVAVSVAGVPKVAAVGAVKALLVLSWAALIPVVAQRKRRKKGRERNIPDVDRTIEVTFVWTGSSHSALEEALKHY